MSFDLGEVIVTPRASQLLAACGKHPDELLNRHRSGDWGDVTDAQRRLNDVGIKNKLSIVSSFDLDGANRVMIFTKADRSQTLMHVMPRASALGAGPHNP